jgi:hypothetical protein
MIPLALREGAAPPEPRGRAGRRPAERAHATRGGWPPGGQRGKRGLTDPRDAGPLGRAASLPAAPRPGRQGPRAAPRGAGLRG